MLKKSIYRKNLPLPKMELSNIMDIIELIAIIVCIPLSYFLTEYLIDNFKFPFYEVEFKLFILQYFNYFNHSWQFDLTQFAIFSILILISWYTLSQLTVMAKLPRNQKYLTVIIHFIRGNFFILLILISFKYILNLTSISIVFIFTYVAISMLVTLAIRLISIYKIKIFRANGYNLWHVMAIVDENYIGIVDEIIQNKEWGIKIVSLITGSEKIKRKYGHGIDVFPDTNDIKDIIDRNIIDEVLYCKKDADDEEILRLAGLCNETGVVFRIQSCESTVDSMQINPVTVNQNGNLTLVDTPALKLPLEIKTIADLYLSLIAVFLLSPLLLLITILIKLDSKGPVFFKQERVGLRGRKFRLFKFRTMVVNAEELKEQLKESNEMDGPTFKMKNDPRITRLGSFLRKTGIDEFPQLYNVIRGEMSLIGPRPPLESEVKQYKRWQLRRLSVKPGITCTWQIMPQRNDIKFDKWMQMDLNYIDNWSLGRDAQLVYKTITAFFLAAGR
jgi:exopolysaccharide biosynthesis polyprenyl glycosylphosphotransferase